MSLPKPYYTEPGITIYNADCRLVLPHLPKVDSVITDPPFSERTHAGHDSSARGYAGQGKDSAARKTLGYAHFSEADVSEYVRLVKPICEGWIITMTDHTLMPRYCADLENCGRYVFAPIPYFAPGSTVRLSGDGPCSWTTWIIVSRTSAQVRWGTLPGGYVAQPGWVGAMARMGGKPLGLMRALVRDYSREGQAILDPFMGSGTTLVAAKQLGRTAIGIEISERCCQIAVDRLRQDVLPLSAPDPQPSQDEFGILLGWQDAIKEEAVEAGESK